MKNTATPQPIEAPDRLRLCVEAGIHPESLRRYLGGRPVRTMTRRRIEAAAKTLGFDIKRQQRIEARP